MDEFEEREEEVENELDQNRAARFIAEFSLLYLEIVAGLRAPEQLARWLGEANFLALHDARLRQARARAFLKLGPVAPKIVIQKVAFFPAEAGVQNAVVLFKWSGLTRAMTVVTSRSNHRQRFLSVDIVGA